MRVKDGKVSEMLTSLSQDSDEEDRWTKTMTGCSSKKKDDDTVTTEGS